MDNDGNMTEQKFACMEFQISPIDYHTWGCPVLFLEAPLQRGPEEIPKWEPTKRTRLYPGHSPFHTRSVALLFNTITGNISPHYHVVFDDTFSTVEHMRKGTVPGNKKNGRRALIDFYTGILHS